MAGVFTTTSTVVPAKLYKAFVNYADDVVKADVERIEINEETKKKLNFIEGGANFQKIEGIDEANYTCRIYEKISFEAKVAEFPNGASIGKVKVKYETKTDAKPIGKEVKGALTGKLTWLWPF